MRSQKTILEAVSWRTLMHRTNILTGTETETGNGSAVIGTDVVSVKRGGDTEEWNANDGCRTDPDTIVEAAISTGGEDSVVTKQDQFLCASGLKKKQRKAACC